LRLTKNEHLTKSRQNQEFGESIDVSSPAGIEWAVTITFYVALHYVQAYFASRSDIRPTTHALRARAIQRDPLISGAYDEYRVLEDLSREARYDFSVFTPADLAMASECLASVQSVIRLHL
jgi:hypothetical protein